MLSGLREPQYLWPATLGATHHFVRAFVVYEI